MKVSLLVPFQPDGGYREQNWSVIRNRYQRLMPEVEVCCSVDNSEPFCKAKAVNDAAEQAHGDLFLITDADVVFEPELIFRLISVIPVYPWVQPFTTCVRLSEDATNRLIEQHLPSPLPVRPEDGLTEKIKEAGPLMNAMTRSCFEAVRGYDERFKGWGWEDIAFSRSLDTICGPHFRMEDTIYHLWHPSSAKTDSPEYQRNLDLHWRYYYAAVDSKESKSRMKALIDERYQELSLF